MIDDADPFSALDELLSDEFGIDAASAPDAEASPPPKVDDRTSDEATAQPEQPRPEPAVQRSKPATLTTLHVHEAETAAPLKAHAERIAHKLLTVIEAAHDAGELDVDDAGALLPKVHRVKVDEEKVELQRSGGKEDLPVFHISIGSAGIRAEQAPQRVLDVVEQVAPEPVPEQAQRLEFAGFSVALQPIDKDGAA